MIEFHSCSNFDYYDTTYYGFLEDGLQISELKLDPLKYMPQSLAVLLRQMLVDARTLSRLLMKD